MVMQGTAMAMEGMVFGCIQAMIAVTSSLFFVSCN
jgi:hypothetical protein